MKIKRFTAKNVRGYLNFDINFRDSLTFLIGINGSGKTTAIKLLLGLLTPSYEKLCQIEFERVQLECVIDSDKKTLLIVATKKGDELFFSVKKGKEPSIDEAFKIIPFADKDKFSEESFNQCSNKFEFSLISKKIKTITPPLFLGLDRKMSERYFGLDEARVFLSRHRKRGLRDDNVNYALDEVQGLVYDYTRLIAKKQPEFSSEFRNQIFTESFIFRKNPTAEHFDYPTELKKLDTQEKELDCAITNLDLNDISSYIKSFFVEIKSTLKTLTETASVDPNKKSVNQEYFNALMHWLVNSYQLNRVDKIIEYSKDYQEKIQKLNEPISRLQESVNMFLKEGNKKMIVTGDGELKILINTPTKTISNSIFELSSGEKQIIIMIAHLVFFSKSKSSIFVIDEPELSLHISWQEIFVDALLKASPNTQFILATHAPSIIAKQERERECEDLTMKIK